MSTPKIVTEYSHHRSAWRASVVLARAISVVETMRAAAEKGEQVCSDMNSHEDASRYKTEHEFATKIIAALEAMGKDETGHG